MKTLKSNGGSFGISIMNTNGIPYRAETDGYSSADAIKEFSIYRVCNDSAEETFINGLPLATTAGKMYGTLVTFPYSSTRVSQVFIRYNVSDSVTGSGIYVRHHFTDGQWSSWKVLAGTVLE